MTSARPLAFVVLISALALGGCTTATVEDVASECSDYFGTAFGYEPSTVLTDFEAAGYPEIMGTPTCAFGNYGAYVGVYLDATHNDFDEITARWVAAGFTATPVDLGEDSDAFNAFELDEVEVATLELGTFTGESEFEGSFMIAQGSLDE